MAPRIKRRTSADWCDDLAKLARIRAAAELDYEAGARSEAWARLVRASSDSLAVLLAVSPDGEAEALTAARTRLTSALSGSGS